MIKSGGATRSFEITQHSASFDQFASNFAAATDRRIHKARYFRGELFLNAVSQAVKRGGFVLDYGCGPGRLSRMLALESYSVLGVDPSAAMIKEAKAQDAERLPLEFRLASGLTEITFEADGIVCSSVIEYVPNPAKLLTWFSQILRASGCLIISFSNANSLLSKIGGKSVFACAELHQWTWPSFRQLLQNTGFRVISGPRYFESPFDVSPVCRFMSNNRWVGSLGLITAQKV